MESKSSATSSPRAALKVSITKKVNDRLKNDLKELEKVSMPKIKPSLGQKSERNYPSLKDEYVSINEIRSRGYQAAFPAPKSHHYVMKGKNVANTSFDPLNQDEDEGINEPNESASDTDSDPLRSHQNTPNSLYIPEPIQQIAMNRQNFLNYFYSQPKPAILPSTGTASSAKFVQRPRPQKKHKTVLRPLKKAVQYDMVSLDSAKTEVELQQEELEREVKWMVDEAKKIANLKKKKVAKVDKKELDSSPTQNLEDKKIVKGVEGLITAIKSGQLVSEQEQSNKKIQEILGTVLDKTSLSLFDPSFSENLDEQKELMEERSMVDSAINADSTRDSLGVQSVRTITDNLELDPEDKTSRDTDTQIDGQTVKSMVSSYQDEMDTYLASLPPLVTREDVLNTTATSLRLIEKSGQTVEPKKPRQSTGKQKNWRNLHQFCVFEYERRDSMLLPDQLVDVTRKYHVHRRYESEDKESGRPSDSFVSQKSAGFNEQFIAYNRTDRAAKRVVDNLADLMHFDEKKSYTTIDSGFEDSELDVWKKKAEQSLELEGKQVVMQSFADYKEFTLTFLKPAPPKMSIKPSRIRERLFAEYRSMPPPLDDMNLLANKKRTKMKMFASGSDSLDEENGDGSDEESVDESALEFELILDKLLNRQYCSDTDLSKFERENERVFDGGAKMARSMSESACGKSGHAQPDVYDYDFMRIDSNYNEALEEAVNQKKVIKSDYLKKSRLISGSVSSLKSKTKSMQGEKIDFKNDKSMSSTNGPNQADGNFFPKNVEKSLADIALAQGKKYVMQDSTKTSRKNSVKKKPRGPNRFKNSVLGMEFLIQIESDIYNKNIKALNRCHSLDQTKSRTKTVHQDDELLAEAARVRHIRRPSVSKYTNFEEYKKQLGFKDSKWATEQDDYFDKEREWTRDIWNVWFDQVIAGDESQLNDSNEKPKLFDIKKETKIESEKESGDAEEMEEEGDKIRKIVKSPTPYATYSQINFEDLDENKLNFQHIKVAEKEIEVLNRRLEQKLLVFDLVRRGTLYRKLGFIKKALDDFNLAIDTEPKFVDAYWQRHLIYLVQDRRKDATEELNQIIKLNRSHSGAYLSLGDLYAQRNDLQMAIVNYSQAVKFNPNDDQAFFKRGKLYEQKGDVRMAMDDYLTTTRLNPKNSEAWFKHGMSYFNSKNWHYAIVDFTELIKHNPLNQAQARLYRGKCHLNLEDYQAAFDDFCVALHLNPNDWQSYYHRACLLRKLDPTRAIQDLSISILIEEGYENLKSYLHRGILYTELEQYDEAIKDFESVLLLDKEYSPAYVNLGIIFMNLTMNYWKAIKYFNLAIKSNPVYIRAYLCRAQAYRYVHDLKRAYLDYTKAIHMDPTNTQIYIYRGQTILEMGDLKLAAFCVQYASFMKDNVNFKASNDNDFGTVINRGGSAKIRGKNEGISTLSSMTNSVAAQNQSVTQQALVFSFLKNHDKAISVLEQELKVKATTSIYNLLGRVYMKAKKWKEAVMAFEKSIELNFDETKSSKNMSTTSSSFSKMANLTGLKANKKDLIDAYFMKGQCFIETKYYTDAYSSFDKVIDLNPENAQAFYHRGIARVHLKHQRCIQDFNKALALDPSLFEAFLARACIYGMQERYTKAILNCNEAVRLNSKSVRGYLYRGALKYMSRSFNYAIKDLTEAINLDQTCALAYFNRALCYEQIKSFKNALKDFSIVLMLGDFLKFKVLINRGLLYFHTKDYFNALNDFKMAAVYSPSDFDIQHMIGLCLHKLERYSEAISVLSEAYQINPRFFNALISRGNVYVDLGHDKAFEKAQKDYETVLGLYPDNLDAHINLAYLYQITGRFKLAWDQFTKAIQLKPKFIPAYEGRSVVCLQMSDTLAALKDINQAIKIRPNAELLVNRGVIYQFMADNVNAMRDYQSALLMDPTFGLAYFNSANILLLHKQFSQALKNLDMAIDRCHMNDESTYQNRAIARALVGDISGAFRDLCEAIKYGKYTSHLFMNRGIMLYNMENYKLANKDFSTAISLSPNDAVLYKLRADCKGKLDMKDEALVDYQMAVDLKQREKLRKIYGIK